MREELNIYVSIKTTFILQKFLLEKYHKTNLEMKYLLLIHLSLSLDPWNTIIVTGGADYWNFTIATRTPYKQQIIYFTFLKKVQILAVMKFIHVHIYI